MAGNVVVTPEKKRIDILHAVANYMADNIIKQNEEVAIPTLDFLEQIEDKTADDLRKVKDQSKLVDVLGSVDYRDRLRNLLAESLDSLSTEHLHRYHDEMLYEAAMADFYLQVNPALDEVQQELLYGAFSKPTLQ